MFAARASLELYLFARRAIAMLSVPGARHGIHVMLAAARAAAATRPAGGGTSGVATRLYRPLTAREQPPVAAIV